MKCPHCLENFHDEWGGVGLQKADRSALTDNDGSWVVQATVCPACNRSTVVLVTYNQWNTPYWQSMVWPKGIARAPLPPEVDAPYIPDYKEACLVLADSPKASAALSRRCLQALLRDKAGVKKAELYNEIEEVLASNKLPGDLAEALHHVRVIGNFAAHPEKSTATGEIVDVEPGEADWTLEVLESLFDFYFVRPAKLAAQRAALDQKLADVGKKPLK